MTKENDTHPKKDWGKIADAIGAEEKSDAAPTDRDEEEDVEAAEQASSDTPIHILEHPSYKDLEAKLTTSEEKAHAEWDKATRLAAELANTRERLEREVSKAHRYAAEKFVEQIIPVADSLEHAMDNAPGDTGNDMKAFIEGVELTYKMFLSTLEKAAVKQINPKGERFDPQLHEAMSMLENPDLEPNTVIEVLQKGYQIHDRLIRPARVIVNKS